MCGRVLPTALPDEIDNSPNTTNKMKNVNLQIRKLSKAGFSLVEMLVVIAVIGIIAAIAIPNIGNVNQAAKDSTARRNAQSIASVASSAQAAGASMPATAALIYDAIVGGTLTPATGVFKNKVFTVPNLPASTSTDGLAILSYLDVATNTDANGVTSTVLTYKANTEQ